MFRTVRDPRAGAKARDKGKAAVMAVMDEQWRTVVMLCCAKFVASRAPGDTFTGEDLRRYCEPHVGVPHHPNAWSAVLGAMIRSWVKHRMVEAAGVTTAKDPKAHARLIRQYRTVALP